jgi:hypothetical protein
MLHFPPAHLAEIHLRPTHTATCTFRPTIGGKYLPLGHFWQSIREAVFFTITKYSGSYLYKNPHSLIWSPTVQSVEGNRKYFPLSRTHVIRKLTMVWQIEKIWESTCKFGEYVMVASFCVLLQDDIWMKLPGISKMSIAFTHCLSLFSITPPVTVLI